MKIQTVAMAGFRLDLMRRDEVLRWLHEVLTGDARKPVAIESANLDHVRWFAGSDRTLEHTSSVQWLTLLDGSPLALEALALTGRRWPRLTGADLLEPILEIAEQTGRSVGFLGGMPEMHQQLRARLSHDFPGLRIAGTWAPERAALADPERAAELAHLARDAGTDVLVVALGKPRQERWITDHGAASGARLLLAFGAAADFYAGTVPRAPRALRFAGMEWVYRLATQPKRLARRYLLEGPQSLGVLAAAFGRNRAGGLQVRDLG